MDIEQMKIGDLKQIMAALGGRKEPKTIDGGLRIVILQRGWVVVGRYSRKGQMCRVTNGFVIRKWGTSNGLPELAIKGPLANTVLDKSPDIEFHQLTEIASIQCLEEKWLGKLDQ